MSAEPAVITQEERRVAQISIFGAHNQTPPVRASPPSSPTPLNPRHDPLNPGGGGTAPTDPSS